MQKTELIDPEAEAERLLQYIDYENDEFKSMMASADNFSEMRDAILIHTKPGFNLVALFGNDSPTANRIAEAIKKLVVKESQRELKSIVRQEIKKPKREFYSRAEILWLKRLVRKGLEAKDIYPKYIEQDKFPARTYDAITKKIQEIKEGKIRFKE